MRIHTDTLTNADMYAAARAARVDFDRFKPVGSRSRDHGFDFTLQGESRRHQNGGDGMAATWDQWGVFLGFLFRKDDGRTFEPSAPLTIPRIYADVEEFNYKTDYRFFGGFPSDYHGDHTFRYSGIPFQQNCTKCTAVMRWR